MRKFARLIALLLSIALLLGMLGCGNSATPTGPATTTAPPPETTQAPTDPPIDGAAVYSAAIAPLLTAPDVTLKLNETITTTIGPDTFTTISEQDLIFSGLGTDSMAATLSETVNMGGLDDSFEEYYADGTLYTTVYGQYKYKGAMTQEDFLARFAPVALLDTALYEQITAEEILGGMKIAFESPTAGESWALPEGAELITASGTATVRDDGTMTQCTYTAEFHYGASHIQLQVTAVPQITAGVTITAPNADDYTELSFIEAPRIYDTALLYLMNTKSATSMVNETIVCQAAAVVRSQQVNIDFHGTDNDHVSEVAYNISFYQNGVSDSLKQTEHFQDDKYTVSVDGGAPQAAAVASSDMLAYCQGFLTENTVDLSWFSSVEATQIGGILFLDFDCSDGYGQLIYEYISSVLFQDEKFLEKNSTAFETTSASSYLAVDLYTGFPTAAGIHFEGNHTIEGQKYALSLQSDQSFQLASLTAYETVTGESLLESEPETKATPLFYHVTGENGQQMWLMGTIHVGDARTAYLPQEIYNAFTASDALAVEFDTDAFEESLETDTQLVSQLSSVYFYADGSAIKDHLDEELYDQALLLLKASGNYNANAEYMKPFLWEQSISNFYLQLGYQLVSEKGMDNRLLKLAREQNKEIRDIESGLAQLQMLAGYSEELQELLLEDSLEYTSAEYCAGVEELYELWCAGDEAALREELSSTVDTESMTDEELAEYEDQKALIDEYNKAMSFDRNKGMLKVAIDYLESGETIFYAVGLAHLLDDVNGLVDALRDAGYTVELVQYAS